MTLQKKKPQILLVEIGSHPGEIQNRAKLFSHLGDVTVITRPDMLYLSGEFRSQALFPVWNLFLLITKKIVVPPFLYFLLMFKAPFAKLVFINTAPEYNQKSLFSTITYIGYLIFSIFFGKKTIIHMRNIDAYQYPENSGLFNTANILLQRMALIFLERITVDSQTVLDSAVNNLPIKSKKLCILGQLYSDMAIERFETVTSAIKGDEQKIRIGLLGRVETARRDYSLLDSVLCKMKNETLEKMQLVVLGACMGEVAFDTIKMLRNNVEVECEGGFLEPKTYIEKGNSCDVLLAPLKQQLGYGAMKETGAYGDAFFFGIKVIIPAFACPSNSFERISITYEDADTLQVVLEELMLRENNFRLNREELEPHTTSEVCKRMVSELGLSLV